jgi:hypothetical protein
MVYVPTGTANGWWVWLTPTVVVLDSLYSNCDAATALRSQHHCAEDQINNESIININDLIINHCPCFDYSLSPLFSFSCEIETGAGDKRGEGAVEDTAGDVL